MVQESVVIHIKQIKDIVVPKDRYVACLLHLNFLRAAVCYCWQMNIW